MDKVLGFDIDAVYEQFTERAAIHEYDGGLSREDAERMALAYILQNQDRRSLHG